MAGKLHHGHCLCGAVKFTVEPANSAVAACHCGMCRRWTGGPYLGVDCGTSFKTDDDTDIGIYESSQWAERAFCRKCGTTLFYRLKQDNHTYVSAGAIDDLEDPVLTDEVFIDEKPGYYSFEQDTKKMTGEELFAFFSGQES